MQSHMKKRLNLESPNSKGHAIPKLPKPFLILCDLWVFSAGMSPSLLCRLGWLLKAAQHQWGQCTHFPQAADEVDFFSITGFPNVIRATDGTHGLMNPPSENSHIYQNRKHTSSISIQAVCNAKCLITNVVGQFPSSPQNSQMTAGCLS